MTFLPIVERELRVASRRRTTFWGRMLLSSLAIVIGVCTFCVNLGEDQAEAGPIIFRWLAGAMLLYATFYGARSTADSLSSEKRDGTLGLLFLTDLKGYDIVLGKMAATGLNGLYALLAVFPVLAVPLLMGGTTQGEFWRMVLVLVDTFLFSLAIGIFASAVCRDARSAMSANFLFVIIPSVMLPGLSAILADGSPRNLIHELMFASPGYPFVMSFDHFYATESDRFWMSLVTIHGLTWICVILASNIVPRTWQDRPSVRSARPGLREMWRQRRYGNPIQRAALRTRLLAHNAFLWLACRDRRKQFRVWMFLGFMAAWWTWGRVQSGYVWFEAGIALFAAFLVNSALKMWVAFETSERLAEDRGNGALELLLSTRMTVPDILEGQRLALQRIFVRPVLVVFVAEIYLLWLSLERAIGSDFINALLTWLAIFAMFVADALALYWVGLYTAMTSRRPGQAAMAAVLRVLALPWVILGLLNVFISVAVYFEALPQPGYLFYLGVWVGLGLVTDAFFARRARRQLLTRFRELPVRVTQRVRHSVT